MRKYKVVFEIESAYSSYKIFNSLIRGIKIEEFGKLKLVEVSEIK